MAYRHTVISNLKYVDEVFHNIAHNIPHPNEQGYEGQDDDTLLKWECIDDRFATGFGSTYEVVVNDFKKRNEEVTITIFGDTWLHVETVAYREHYMDKWETLEGTTKIDRIAYRESLPEVLGRVYQNGTINLVGNFSVSNNTEINLDDVINYLQGLSSYPDYFIFNGATKTLGTSGKSATVQKLKDIDNFCISNGIKACCVFTENRNLQGVNNKDWAETFSTTTAMLKFSVLEWATHHLHVLESNYNVNGNDTKIDEFFDTNDLNVSAYALSKYITTDNLDNDFECYEELIYTVVKRFILENMFILHRECFYISLLYKSIDGGLDGSTYNYYFGTDYLPYNLMSCFTKNEVTIRISDEITGHHQSKYASDQHWNFFKNDGQFVAVCVHTSYSEYLWACQQGQSNCYDEFIQLRKLTDYSSGDIVNKTTINPANLIPERLYRTGASIGEAGNSSPPIFLGTGCPMLTISWDNRERYSNKLGLSCPIEIWITRDNNSASITLRLHTEEDYQDLYQSIEFGKMTSVETENYIYPLYCGGGSIGLSADIYVYFPINGGNKTHIEGNVYDLDMNNISMSNSNILHPTKFWNCSFTNFKVLTPEGIWRSIYAHEQTASVQPYPSLGPPPDFAIHLNSPTHNHGANNDGAYPFLLQNWNSVGSQHIGDFSRAYNGRYGCKEPCDNKKVKFNSRWDAIRIGLNHSIGHGQYLCYGSIPKCWRSWDKDIPSGEFTCNGKKYLVVPCGWDGRLWDYSWHLDIYNDLWETYDIVDHFENKYYKQNARIDDKLIIELGDVNV